MMRMKIQMLAMMFIAALALGACSDDDDKDDVKVPEAMSQAIEVQIPFRNPCGMGTERGLFRCRL